MTQILIIEGDETLSKIIKLNLVKDIGCDVVIKRSAIEAIELLKLIPDVDLILCREVIKNEKSASLIGKYLTKEQTEIPLVVIGNNTSEYKNSFQLDAGISWQDVVKRAHGILKGEQAEEAVTLPTYVPVSIYYFLNINTLIPGCDVYIRVKKSEAEFQYVKRIHAGDQFSREDILRYQEGGLNEFYVAQENFNKFVNYVTADLIKKLGDQNISGTQRITLSSDAYKITQDRIHVIGVDEFTVRLAEESIYSMTSLLKEKGILSTFLKSLKNNECSYAYAHAYLCCLILHKIISKFEWQSQQIKDKLAYIAYFHDISLEGSELTEINNLADFESAILRDEARRRVENHALESARIVGKFNMLPPGVDTIIKEHHGSKTGIGFVDNYSATLLPLSMMFIVTESFVDELLKVEGAPKAEDFKRIFSKLQLKFNKSTYGQTLVALQNMVAGK